MSAIRRSGTLFAASLLGIAACTPGVKVETAPPPLPVIIPDINPAEMTNMEIRGTSGLTWTDLVVPGFPSGGKMAVLHGNPAGTEDYTLRLMFPDGYEFPEHWHPGGEHVTVLTGNLHLGMGSPNPAMLKDYAPGDFIYIPGHMSHFGGAHGVTIIQLHGNGPFVINLGTAK